MDAYGIKLPGGYTRQGDLYVYKPEPTKEAPKADLSPESVEELPDNLPPILSDADMKKAQAYLEGDKNALDGKSPELQEYIKQWAAEPVEKEASEATQAYERAYKALDQQVEYRRLVEFKLNALGVQPTNKTAAGGVETAK